MMDGVGMYENVVDMCIAVNKGAVLVLNGFPNIDKRSIARHVISVLPEIAPPRLIEHSERGKRADFTAIKEDWTGNLTIIVSESLTNSDRDRRRLSEYVDIARTRGTGMLFVNIGCSELDQRTLGGRSTAENEPANEDELELIRPAWALQMGRGIPFLYYEIDITGMETEDVAKEVYGILWESEWVEDCDIEGGDGVYGEYHSFNSMPGGTRPAITPIAFGHDRERDRQSDEVSRIPHTEGTGEMNIDPWSSDESDEASTSTDEHESDYRGPIEDWDEDLSDETNETYEDACDESTDEEDYEDYYNEPTRKNEAGERDKVERNDGGY